MTGTAEHTFPLKDCTIFVPMDHLDQENEQFNPDLICKFLQAKAQGRTSGERMRSGTPSREFLYLKGSSEALNLRGLMGYEGELFLHTAYPDGQPKRKLDTSRGRARCGREAEHRQGSGPGETTAWRKGALRL